MIVAFAASCGENSPPARTNSAEAVANSGAGASASRGGAAGSDSPIPPKDAQWTIYCQAIGGPGHVERAKAIKDELIKTTGMKEWYVIHQEGESVIYYGFYRSINDAKDSRESARAQRDKKQVNTIADSAGGRVFSQSFFVEVTAPDPVAPPEWNLANAAAQGAYWSLQIAAYKDSPQRKEAAVEAVREARKRGIPAYYYHGETTSSVCVGVWPRAAVREQEEAVAGSPDPTQDILVLPQPLSTDENVDVRNRQGQRVHTVAPRIEPQDPSLLAMIQQYPSHAVNGNVMTNRVKDPVTGRMVEVADPSFLVIVPKSTSSILSPSAMPEVATPALINPTGGASGSASGGRLRSLGE